MLKLSSVSPTIPCETNKIFPYSTGWSRSQMKKRESLFRYSSLDSDSNYSGFTKFSCTSSSSRKFLHQRPCCKKLKSNFPSCKRCSYFLCLPTCPAMVSVFSFMRCVRIGLPYTCASALLPLICKYVSIARVSGDTKTVSKITPL